MLVIFNNSFWLMKKLSFKLKFGFLIVFLLISFFLIVKSASGAGVSIDSCPSVIDTDYIQLKGSAWGDYVERPCPLETKCVSWYDQYAVSEVKWYLYQGGSFLRSGDADFTTSQEAIDGTCTGNCEGRLWTGRFDTGRIGGLEDNKRYRVKVCAKAYPGYNPGCESCQFDVRINDAPSIELREPYHDVWINYTPWFRGAIRDPDFPNDSARAYYSLPNGSGVGGSNASGWGNWVSTNNDISEYRPYWLSDGQWWWRAYAQDEAGAWSGWTSYWLVKKDEVKPSATLDQENGYSSDTSIWVKLTESDDRSGVATGDVDVQINDGAWQDYATTINDFTYTGSHCNKYEFRYRVKDNAGNWSDFAYDGSVVVDTQKPTAQIDQENGYSTDTTIWVKLTEINDCDRSPIVQGDVDLQINDGTWQHYASTLNDFEITGSECNKYEFRYRIKDSAGNWSSFDYDGSVIVDVTAPSVEISYPSGTINCISIQFKSI